LSESVTGEQYVEPLDASRVHPEAYEWARKMAVDALEFDESEDGANPSDALQTILDSKDPKDAEKLEELDLEAFGAELERMDLGNKRITLDEIRRELRGRFCETRPNYRSPNDVKIFEMIVGESINEYRKGRLLAPTVRILVRKTNLQFCLILKILLLIFLINFKIAEFFMLSYQNNVRISK
jgi:transcription elongation factor SPT6